VPGVFQEGVEEAFQEEVAEVVGEDTGKNIE
jgi:hypothetical protein